MYFSSHIDNATHKLARSEAEQTTIFDFKLFRESVDRYWMSKLNGSSAADGENYIETASN